MEANSLACQLCTRCLSATNLLSHTLLHDTECGTNAANYVSASAELLPVRSAPGGTLQKEAAACSLLSALGSLLVPCGSCEHHPTMPHRPAAVSLLAAAPGDSLGFCGPALGETASLAPASL